MSRDGHRVVLPTDTAPHAAEPALEVCRGCRVRSMCLVEALLVEDPARRYGVLGATTPQDRRRLHRTARVAARRSTAPAAVPTGERGGMNPTRPPMSLPGRARCGARCA
ncbi:WhiB family transcriptional regulator [Pseudonocardia sp. ICBG1142]|uniref:WhiB family transcriptional regulator n=1 Tax=Pseudonocardia sp. ICBG1142 TaxID=2846760 RepID=UPI001CF6F798|nr:WhiB family transcriptional regulator [Pseudonocardia sp. ICBG1142]